MQMAFPPVPPGIFSGPLFLTELIPCRTGRYKLPTIMASCCSIVAFTGLALLWRGETGFWGSLLILPAGFATGIAHSALFIGLASGVGEDDIAIAGSGLYLSANVGSVAGVSVGNAVYQASLRHGLMKVLDGWSGREEACNLPFSR